MAYIPPAPRIDPRDLRILPKKLEENHKVLRIDEIPNCYGFSLCEQPSISADDGKPIVEVYVDGAKLSYIDLEQKITKDNFQIVYESDDVHFRIGDIYVHASHLGKVAKVIYQGLGALNNPQNHVEGYFLPVGYVYTQYPKTEDPNVLFPRAIWQKLDYSGDFFRAEGGLASEFQSGKQEESVPNIKGTIGSDRGVFKDGKGAFLDKNQSTQGVWDGGFHPTYKFRITADFDASRSSPAYGRRDEVAPQNQTIRIWKKIGNIGDFDNA